MVAAFSSDKRSNVYVRLEASTLSYIAEHLIASGRSTRNAPKPSPYTFNHNEIKWNTQTKRPYMNYRDADGTIRFKAAKLRRSADDDDFDLSVLEASEKLHEEYLGLHHPDGDDDPDGDDAEIFDGESDDAQNALGSVYGGDENGQDDAVSGNESTEIADADASDGNHGEA